MSYAIMRTAKLKTSGSVASSLSHTNRERETPNADQERTKENEILVQGDMEKFERMTDGVKQKKDSVQCIEVLCTKSPEWDKTATPEQKDEFNRRSLEWAEKTFGKENILSAVVHKDETTDHVVIHVIPVKDNQLNAKHWTGGKEKLRELQTSFSDKVKDLGLDRGTEGSKARHVEIAKYYARVNEPPKELAKERLIPQIHLPEPIKEYGGLKQERLEDYGKRCAFAVLEVVKPKVKELTEQVEALKKERDHFREHSKWTRGKARTVTKVKERNQELEQKVSTLTRQVERESGKRQQLEKGVQQFMKVHGPALSTVQRNDIRKATGLSQGIER